MAPPGFIEEGGWLLNRDPQPDTALLFECLAPGGHNLLSGDNRCEGLLPLGPVGWVNTVQKPGTVPLYRCATGGDHFVSSDPRCEGTIVEGLLGFVIPN